MTVENTLDELDEIIADRVRLATNGVVATASYTQRLLADRNLRLKKIGEESAELVTACADGNHARSVEEAADVLYHALVAVHAVGGRWKDIEAALARRREAPVVLAPTL